MNNASITTSRGVIVCNTFRFPVSRAYACSKISSHDSGEGKGRLNSHHATCRKGCHLLSHRLGMKFLADSTSTENRANCLPDMRSPQLLAYFRNDMFTPKVTDQFMGVANHRPRSKASDPLEDDLICRVDGGWRG